MELGRAEEGSALITQQFIKKQAAHQSHSIHQSSIQWALNWIDEVNGEIALINGIFHLWNGME